MLKLCVICHTIGKPFDKKSPAYTLIPAAVIARYINALTENLCPKCENKNCMIPIDSPRAQKIIQENDLEIVEFIREKEEQEYHF